MLLGIDASRALSATPTGTETYSHALTTALLQAPSPLRFRLYTRSLPPPDFFPRTSNYDVRAIPFPRLWTHARLSTEMLLHPPDALWVPAHVIPLIHPRRSLVTVHDLGYLHFPQAHRARARFYLDLATRWNARVAARVLVDSDATAADLEKFYHVPRAKISVVYPAYDAARFNTQIAVEQVAAVQAKYALGDDYVLTVGTLHPRKNYERLLRALDTLPARYQLVIAGRRGWLDEGIVAQLRALGARARWLEYVAAADLPALYRGARAFVFPSLYEGFGLPVLEAQACGVAVACSNTSSLPKVASDGAEYFDPRDEDAIGRALLRVLEDEARRAELIAHGRANVARFDWERAAQTILELVAALNHPKR